MQTQKYTYKKQTQMIEENSFPSAPKLKPVDMDQQFDELSLDENTLPSLSLDDISLISPHSQASQQIEPFEQKGPKRGYTDYIKAHLPCNAPRRVRKVVHYDTNYKFQ